MVSLFVVHVLIEPASTEKSFNLPFCNTTVTVTRKQQNLVTITSLEGRKYLVKITTKYWVS